MDLPPNERARRALRAVIEEHFHIPRLCVTFSTAGCTRNKRKLDTFTVSGLTRTNTVTKVLYAGDYIRGAKWGRQKDRDEIVGSIEDNGFSRIACHT